MEKIENQPCEQTFLYKILEQKGGVLLFIHKAIGN